MGQLQGYFLYRNKVIVAVLLGLILLSLALASLPVRAQSGCTGDPCLFYTPTPTSTSTPRPTEGPGTPTAVPMPGATPFPRPHYGIPTSIPNISFPAVPSPLSINLPTPDPLTITPSPWPMPSPMAGPLLTVPAPISPETNLPETNPTPLSTVDTNLVITYSALQPLEGSGVLTGSSVYTLVNGLNEDGQGFIGEMVSYTNYISGEAAALQHTDSMTLYAAPDWYAPYLPREMANIGWSFEQIGDDSVARYSLNTWAWLFGTMIAMPIRLVRAIWDLFRFMGPFGLFMIWLLVVMLPAVLGFKVLLFIKNTIVRLINFALNVIDWLLKLWEAIPFVN